MIKLKYNLNGMYRGVCPQCHTIVIVPERMVNAERETKCKCEIKLMPRASIKNTIAGAEQDSIQWLLN